MDLNAIIEDIRSDRVKKVILDTDTDNEVDDQFALAYAIGAGRVELLSVNAAPFSHPERDITFKMGADASYVEIGRVLEAYGGKIPYFRGAETTIDQNGGLPVDSPAARNIIDTAMASDEIIYVLGIGAGTNIASAIMMEPAIKEKICVIWLCANELHCEHIYEYNLDQDFAAGKEILNSGVPFIMCPAWNVTGVLWVNMWTIKEKIAGKSPLCELLWQLINQVWYWVGKPQGYGRTLWDIASVAILEVPEYAHLKIVKAPIFTDEHKFAFDDSRHDIIYLEKLDRDEIYENLWEILPSIECTGTYRARWTEPEN
ncbi:MAG: nucleoside hydrolase [Clostridia bacterium]|nr:nucleoside hydrolase [Clostridia bacterium]